MKKVKLGVNGIWRWFVVPADRVLLDILRQDLHLTGAKQSCDRKGQCGACTVMVNGKATRSCLAKAADLDGDFGIATRDGLHCAPLVHRRLGTGRRGGVRFSLGPFNTSADIDRVLEAMAKICATG
ncbi:MAG: aminotransferase class V-fold PLP-dependent enzyme [Pseudomonadota bacterium]